jgi:hypothetical protein
MLWVLDGAGQAIDHTISSRHEEDPLRNWLREEQPLAHEAVSKRLAETSFHHDYQPFAQRMHLLLWHLMQRSFKY